MEQASTSTPRVTKAAWAHFIIIMSHFKAASETSLMRGVGEEALSLKRESLEDLERNADLCIFNHEVAQNSFLYWLGDFRV